MVGKSYLEENSKIIEFLKKIPVFEIFDEEGLRNLMRISKLNRYQSGQIIMKEGETDTYMYFLVQGAVEITKKRASRRDITPPWRCFWRNGRDRCRTPFRIGLRQRSHPVSVDRFLGDRKIYRER